MTNKNEEYAEKVAGKWFYENFLDIVGTKTIGDYMYIKGFNGGFQHASAYVKN